MRDAAPLGNASPFAIRGIWPHERGLIRDHLLRLSSEDRASRFCHAPSWAFVSSYCDTIDWLRASVLGCFDEGALWGIAELIRIEGAWPARAELALSVEAPYQNRGIGSALLRQGSVASVLVTDGTEGACLGDEDGIHHCPAARCEVMGTAGAGDAFIATIATFLAEGAEPDAALRSAAVNAASVVSQIDTQGGLLSAAALGERVTARAGELPVGHWRWTG